MTLRSQLLISSIVRTAVFFDPQGSVCCCACIDSSSGNVALDRHQASRRTFSEIQRVWKKARMTATAAEGAEASANIITSTRTTVHPEEISNHPAAGTLSTSVLSPSRQGIDIQQALSILSARSEPYENNHPHHGGGCGCSQKVPENAKAMGQTIDLMATTTATTTTTTAKTTTSSNINHQEEELQQDQEDQNRLLLGEGRTERLQKIQAELNSMSDRELLQAVLQAQQDRVATYRDYESGLMTVLQTGNMTFYPDTCSKATAAFSVLSETIKAIQAIFQQPQRQRNDLVQLIVQLQGHEKEKLHLTAAHHLERIRQRNQQLQPQQSGDPRIGRLLQEGVQILQQKIHTCVEHINEVLEEIRCAILEEDEQKKNGGI